jgi:fibro-slime domain-containing protein
VVNGDIRILVDRDFTMGSDGRIVIPDGSRLTIYVMDEADLRQCVINPDTANPDKFNLIVLGTSFQIDTGSIVCGRIHSPNATLTIRNGSQFYGTFSGDSADLDNSVGFHMDVHRYTDDAMQDDPGLGDTDATLLAGSSDGGIDSASTFDTWFKSVLGVNLAQPALLSLIRQPDGSYLFDDTTDSRHSELGGFFPADGLLFGPEHAGDNNHHFTFRIDAFFVYDAGAGQFLRVTSDSEVWVFVNDELAIDLGGVHGTLDQRVDLDRLCLDDGEAYAFSFFLANRYEPQPRLRFHTNMPLVSGPATASAGFD